MRYVLYIYAGFLALFFVWAIADSLMEKEQLSKIVAEALLYLATITGTFLYAFSVRNESLIQAWKVIGIVVVVVHVWWNLRDRINVLSGRDEEFRDKPPPTRAVLAADLTTGLILGPALLVNILYGYA